MSRIPKHTFWAADGVWYGRVGTFPTAESFLTRIYGVGQEDDENAFYKDWKAKHPLARFLETELPQVTRHWCCWRFFDGGMLALDYTHPKARGAFEIWEWV